MGTTSHAGYPDRRNRYIYQYAQHGIRFKILDFLKPKLFAIIISDAERKSKGVNPLVQPFDLTLFAPISLPINPTLCKVDCISSQALLLLEMLEKKRQLTKLYPFSSTTYSPLILTP